MASTDLKGYWAQMLKLGPLIRASGMTEVRLAYQGMRLAPVAGVDRDWLLEALRVPGAPPESEPLTPPDSPPIAEFDEPPPRPVEDSVASDDEPTEALESSDADPDDGFEPSASGEAPATATIVPPDDLSAAAVAWLDAVAWQMRVIDILSNQDFRLESLTVDDVAWLDDAVVALPELRGRLAELGRGDTETVPMRRTWSRLAGELATFESFVTSVLANLMLAVAADDAAMREGAPPPLELPALIQDEDARDLERSRTERGATKPPPVHPRGQVMRAGKLKIRFSQSEIRVLTVVAFGVMPMLLVGLWFFKHRSRSVPIPSEVTADAVLSAVRGRAEGRAYVVELGSWSDFGSERAHLIELTKAIAAKGFEAARFESGGRTVAVWEQGHIRPGP